MARRACDTSSAGVLLSAKVTACAQSGRAGIGGGGTREELWAELALLPRTGCPTRDHRSVLGALQRVLRTGVPWRDLPERFVPCSTAWSRFRRWTAAGVSVRVLAMLQRLAECPDRLDWANQYVDGTIVRAHQHAAGAVGGQVHEALGRNGGGFSTKVHLGAGVRRQAARLRRLRWRAP